MNVAPASVFEAVIDTGDPGLTGTVGVEANDNQGATVIPFTTTGIVEIAAGVYSKRALTAPAVQGQYTLIWRAGTEVLGVEDLTVTYTAPAEPTPGPPVTAYATTDQLAVLLNLNPPNAAQTEGMQRVLDAAAAEIDWELAYTVDAPAPAPPPPLVVQVNLARAVELWKEAWTGFGIVPLGPDVVPVVTARDSWHRHARTLAPLKTSWAIA